MVGQVLGRGRVGRASSICVFVFVNLRICICVFGFGTVNGRSDRGEGRAGR